ncbi:MAG: NADH-quinone oxidoreductase subunit B family protein [Coriobacteriia bacterium]
MGRPKVAFFDFASCEGCQIEFTNYGDAATLELLKHVEIVEFREAMSEKTDGRIDIALIEGSFTREADRGRLEEIRRRARVVIAYGACAVTGGINALKNHQDDFHEVVYGDDALASHLHSGPARPISSAIRVDYEIKGCPICRDELLHVLSALLHNATPLIPTYPVCVECKRHETVCRYEEGDHCMGQVARAGCGAPCPADGIPCEACRGFVDDANLRALEKVLIERAGFSQKRAVGKARMFTANLRS